MRVRPSRGSRGTGWWPSRGQSVARDLAAAPAPKVEKVRPPRPERGARFGLKALVWLAANDDDVLAESGLFWHDRRPRPIHRFANTRRSDTPEERARLLAWVNQKAGLALPR